MESLKILVLRQLLRVVAAPSPERHQVGAIYRQGWRVMWGYNTSSTYGCHAEDTVIRRFEKIYRIKAVGGVMYCTWSPCSHCTKTLVGRSMTSKYISRYTGKL
jgi:deoxycytidylate deaminase